MKEIKVEEFEELIRQIIAGKRSEASVIKELKTESRTFNNKIQELSLTNPQLYYDFISVRPYKPKERKDINIRGFVIEALKTGVNIQEMCDKYNIGRRTISRKILLLKNSDNVDERNLYDLYKRVASKKSHSKQLDDEDIMEIDALESEEVSGMSDVERRRIELIELERKYQDLSMQVGKEEAARRMGYTQSRIYKLLNELYRIEIERNVENSQRTNGKSYRGSVKVEGIKPVTYSHISDKENNMEKENERESR